MFRAWRYGYALRIYGWDQCLEMVVESTDGNRYTRCLQPFRMWRSLLKKRPNIVKDLNQVQLLSEEFYVNHDLDEWALTQTSQKLNNKKLNNLKPWGTSLQIAPWFELGWDIFLVMFCLLSQRLLSFLFWKCSLTTWERHFLIVMLCFTSLLLRQLIRLILYWWQWCAAIFDGVLFFLFFFSPHAFHTHCCDMWTLSFVTQQLR